MKTAQNVDMVVVGAGFAGLRALHTLRERGLSVAVLEAGGGVGGVWYWNRYPGCRCDVESYDYSYAFSEALEQEWRWSERYAAQPEILRYAEHVVERFDLARDIHLHQRVVSASHDDGRWTVTTESADTWRARFVVMAVGQLSAPKAPDIPGLDAFAGEMYHGARFPHEAVTFAGKRVGIIGTGSTGMQMTPVVAEEAGHVAVFQRTPNFSIPACNAPISDDEDAAVKTTYRERRQAAQNSPSGLGFMPTKQSALDATPAEREATFERAWTTFGFGFTLAYYDLILDQAANDLAADFIRAKIREKVEDPLLAEKLMPRGFPYGTKRPSIDCGYFEAFNRDNVSLVDIREHPIVEAVPQGIVTADSQLHALDVIVFATGFDVFTGSLLAPTITGRDGQTLREKWSQGPQTYLGLGVHGFPNLFILAGPGSPSLLSNVLLSIEQHVDWLADLLGYMHAGRIASVEPTLEAEREWVAHVKARADGTLYPKAISYYNGDEVPGKPRVFMPYVGGVRGYRRLLEECVAGGYAGWAMQPAATAKAA